MIKIVEEFRTHIMEDGKSTNTIQSYVGDITGFLKYLGTMRVEFDGVLKRFYITSYKNYLTFKGSEYLILGQMGAIQRDAVNTLLEKHTVKGNFEMRLQPHTFRHTFCTRLVAKGIPITTVSKLAGHSSIETTAKFYINCSKEEKMRAVSLL